MTHLIDLGATPCDCANYGIETLHKAIAEGPDESALWRAHDNPFIRALVDHSSDTGFSMIDQARQALFGALGLGAPHALLRKSDPVDIESLRARLAKPLAAYTPDDWLALVDLIWATRIPPAAASVAADDLAVKATLAGHLQAISDGRLSLGSAAALIALMDRVTPTIGALGIPFSAREREAAAFARARIGLNLTGVTDAGRARVARSILTHVQEHGLAAPRKLEQTLLDDFGAMNRDWRRIAVTEAGETANVTYAASHPDGSRFKRVEAYEGACPFCRKLDGMVFTWSAAPRPNSDGWSHIWPGKTNVGRAASARKQTPEGLVERTESELWWPAAGVQHPNCRGRWVSLPDQTPPPGVDPAFHAWLLKELET